MTTARQKSEPFAPIDGEEWRVIPSLGPRYEASDLGRIRSWARNGPGGAIAASPRLRVPVVARKRGGYLTLLFHVDGRPTLRYVHQLVLEAFVGPRPAGHVTRHLDGSPTNNRLSNLCWGTQHQNVQDQILHGTAMRGARNVGAKLTQEQAAMIRASGLLGKDLAAMYRVSPATICRIRKGLRYAAA